MTNILTHFLEFDTHMMTSFLYVIKKKKKNIKLNFEKNRLNLLNTRRKINKRVKNRIIRLVWKIEQIELFSQYQLSIAWPLIFITCFSKVFDEIEQVFSGISAVLQYLHVLMPVGFLMTEYLFELSILAIGFQ